MKSVLLTKAVCLQHMDELAEIAMTAHHQQGEHDKALEAARLIRSVPRQAAKLQTLGYWKELADLTQVIYKLLPSLHTTPTVHMLLELLQAACTQT